jgi:hypothetical protein
VSPNLTPPRRGCPIFPRPIAERWEPKISTSARHPLLKQDKASRFPRLNYPPLKKPKGRPASRCHPEEAESRTRDSQRRISALSPANQCRRERPSSCRPETNLSSRAQPSDPVSLNLTPAKQAGAPSFRVLCGKVGTENLDQRTPSISETGQGQSLPKIELPTLEKAQGQASLPLSS